MQVGQPKIAPQRRGSQVRIALGLLVILAAGAYVRLNAIGALPAGLYRDEAFYGLDALNILHGQFALFFAANNGREGLFIYLLSIGIALFGRTPEALRIVSASIGIATIAAIYFVGRQLFSARIGLLSAGILAGTFWHVAISRVAFRAITLPLVLCVAVALWAASCTTPDPKRARWLAVLAGASFGLIFYTYTSGQFVLVLVMGWVIWHRLVQGRAGRQPRLVRSYLVGAAVILMPFVIWLLRHGDVYLARAGQVSILNPVINRGDVLATLIQHIGAAALMFTQVGDRIWRHNLALRPVFDTPLAVAFVIGVGVCVWRAAKELGITNAELRKGLPATQAHSPFSILHSPFLIPLWLITFLVPTILAEDTPHFLRAIGALPAACLVAAVGLEAGLAWLSRRGWLMMTGRLSRHISPPALIATLIIAYGGYRTYQDYFNDYVRRPMTGYWLEQHNVALADDLNTWLSQHPQAESGLWLQDRLRDDNAALRFLVPLLSNTERVHPFHLEGDSLQLQTSSALFGMILFDPNHAWGTLRAALPKSPVQLAIHEGAWAQGDLDPKPHRAYVGLEVSRAEKIKVPVETFEHGITLASARWVTGTAANPSSQTLELRWQATAPPSQDYSVFVHWRRGDKVIAQSDHSPARGYWPMPEWRVGDMFVDQHVLTLPGTTQLEVQPGDEIRMGLYDPATGARLLHISQDGLRQEWVIISPPR